jgi:hypothetical protein
VRYYARLAANGVFAVRVRGLRSFGNNPDFLYYGGNSEMRGYDYLQFVGQRAWFGNAELRFPIFEAVATPFGVMGGLRGTFYADIGGAAINNVPFTFMANSSQTYNPIVGFRHGRCPADEIGPYRLLHDFRAPAGGWPRVVRHRPAELRARLPDALRLLVEDVNEPRLGGRALRGLRREPRVPEDEVRVLDRLRLLTIGDGRLVIGDGHWAVSDWACDEQWRDEQLRSSMTITNHDHQSPMNGYAKRASESIQKWWRSCLTTESWDAC